MLTPDALAQLSEAERVALFNDLLSRVYTGPGVIDRLASDMGVTRNTAYRWKQGQALPNAVLYALDAWAEHGAEQLAWERIATQLTEGAKSFHEVARILSQRHGSRRDGSA